MSDGTQNVLAPLPCPFCGELPTVREITRFDTIKGDIMIACKGTLHPKVVLYCRSKEYADALEAWNSRAAIAPPAVPSLEAFRKAWNDNRGPLAQVTKLTGDRTRKLESRIREGLTLEDFTRAAWRCSHTEFLLRGTPKQQFAATFDWLLCNSGNIARVLEGGYGEPGKTEQELLAEEKEQRGNVDATMAAIAARIERGENVEPFYRERLRKWQEMKQDNTLV